MYNQRDLVLVPVPFTDLRSSKVRPVIILSNNQYNTKAEDVLVVGVTSVLKNEPYSIGLDDNYLEQGKLPLPSRIKCDKIYSLSKKIITRKVGRVKNEKLNEIRKEISRLLEEE
jgi:mRNA interferase MazF